MAADPGLDGFVSKRSLAPMFVALAERCVDTTDGVLAMVAPTVSLANHSGVQERRVLADRFDLHTVLTCRQPGNINQSQNTKINAPPHDSPQQARGVPLLGRDLDQRHRLQPPRPPHPLPRRQRAPVALPDNINDRRAPGYP